MCDTQLAIVWGEDVYELHIELELIVGFWQRGDCRVQRWA
jgi:hypothetical protein